MIETLYYAYLEGNEKLKSEHTENCIWFQIRWKRSSKPTHSAIQIFVNMKKWHYLRDFMQDLRPL